MLGAGCFLGDVTLPPPPDQIYYPTGLVRSPGGSTLYVANSDFDLQYDGGSVLALDLVTMRARLQALLGKLRMVGSSVPDGNGGTRIFPVEEACSTLGININKTLSPGPCLALPLTVARMDEKTLIPSTTIGAFASGAIFVQRKGSMPDARLFIPVRGDPSITFFDVSDDDLDANPETPGAFSLQLDCTGVLPHVVGERCNNKHRIGVEPFESTRAIILPTEPVGIAASEDGTAILVAHQTQQSVSLTIDDPAQKTPTTDGSVTKPTLEFVLGGLPNGPTDVVTVPIPALIKAKTEARPPRIDYQRGFLVTYNAAAVVDLIRVHKDESGTSRPFLTRSNETSIGVNADGKDSRGIAVDGDARHDCEIACATGDTACLLECVKIPIDVFIANRAPPSLLIGRLETTLIPEDSTTPTAAFDKVFITDSIPLAFGASKVAVGKVIDPEGKLSRRVFVGAFDSKRVFSYDPQARRIDAILVTGRGPHALTFDRDNDASLFDKNGKVVENGHAFLIVGHFTDSYLGVIDLDMRHPETFGTMFASVGAPTPPKASKK